MRTFSWRFIRMWQRNSDVFLRLWNSQMPGLVAEPIFVLFSMGIGLGAYVKLGNDQSYIQFIVPGIIASYGMFSASFECTYGSFYRMDEHKTYDAIIATPLSVEDVIAGEIFWGATRSCMTGTIILIVAAGFQLFYGSAISYSPWVLLIPVVAFVGGLLFASIAILYTSAVPSFYSFNYYFTLFITPMFFFSGVFFPLDSFPVVVQRIGQFIPLTPVVTLSRALVNGDLSWDLLEPLAIVLVMIAFFFSVSLMTMRRRLTV